MSLLMHEQSTRRAFPVQDPVEFGHLFLDQGNPFLDETGQLDFRAARFRILLYEKEVGCNVNLGKGV